MGLPPHNEGPCHDIIVIKKQIEDLEENRRDLSRRVSELEFEKVENKQLVQQLFKELETLNSTVNRLSDDIRFIVEKPLKTMEKVKVGVLVSVITAIVVAWSQT